ncbi:hypothetical protein BO94DRAFT_530080 [Aspergillus sclerotioniger CBS 115572]|uniref:Uncharacterized protein n=1 Tax=Aspergillus sclerotioniger CBS 115572 TaxID=1450535 RepID=A0A317XFR5_9EURO|nr:hypothetical protein BO94DRAFT_530080 [Aspergillus sclerotioniger CBS 115572]PWY96702.1 hypothetical protein BO94DRAFT_530080 [Aspergillus sclerotioniger CBS 115572]
MAEYSVYLIKTHLAIQDPDLPSPRYHTTIFVETDPITGSGHIHEVDGDITSREGMHYHSRSAPRPETSDTFFSRTLLGHTPAAGYPETWDTVLKAVPPPPQQKAFNIKRMQTEPFKSLSPLVFYENGEERGPLMKCPEWVVDKAIPVLKEVGCLQVPPGL